MDLQGKKLIFLGGSGLDACAVKRAQELGVRTIVANKYDADRSPAKRIADEAWNVDFSGTERIVSLIKKNQVDGIFVGWTDSHLQHYVKICEMAGLPCCGTAEQFDILSNDKRRFKQLCRECGVPTPEEYRLDIDLKREDLDRIQYPVLVKPADESGSRGIHPTHVKFVNALNAVTKEEYDDACMILGNTAGGVVKGTGANKMNEVKPHTNWANKVCMRARAFGVIQNEAAFVKLFAVDD